MKLIKENIETVKYITESAENGKKKLFIEGTFLVGNEINKNNRMYNMDTLRKEVDRYMTEYVDPGRALGELGHPDTPTINLERVSHKIVSLKESGNSFVGRALILETPYGQIVKNLIDSGVSLGVSSRGLGSMIQTKEGYNLVQDDFKLATAADIVADPSAPGAFVDGIMEHKEWVFVENRFVEVDIESAEKQIRKATKHEIESVALQLFENFIRKL